MTWRTVRLRRILTSAGGSWGTDPEEGEVQIRCIRGTDFDYGALKINLECAPLRGYSSSEFAARSARKGDLIVEKSGGGERQPVGRVVLNNTEETVVPTNFAGRLRPVSGIDSRFICYLMASLYTDGRTVAAIKQTTGIQNLDLDVFLDTQVEVPAEAAQQAIADFLDAETARIDNLLVKKRELHCLIDRRWNAMVRTAALAPGWPLVPLRRLWTVTDCKHKTPNYVDEGFPVVSPGDVTAGRLDLRRCHRFVDHVDFVDLGENGRRPRRGDIVYSRNASIGIAAYVDTDRPFTMGQDVCLIRSATENQLWLTYILNSVGVDQLAEVKVGTTFDRVNIGQLLDLRIPVPPSTTQEAEARRLDKERARVDRLLSTLESQLALLRERREALITAAVTGQLKIPRVEA